MNELKGFWSYVHADDEADGGRVYQLARDVKKQYEMLTGEEIELFVDRDNIRWGEAWRNEIDLMLSSVAFFIPIITPRFFQSPECRRELQIFAHKAENLGIKDLVLPLLYVNFPEFREEETGDELIQLIKSFQWRDWTELRFLELESKGYRKGVAQLAERLVDANRQSEKAKTVEITQLEQATRENEDNLPGVIDKLATFEEEIVKLPNTLDSLSQDIQQISQIMQNATNDIHKADKQNKGFAGRLVIAQRMAKQLSEPTERICAKSSDYASQIHSVDDGVRTFIERAPLEIEKNPDDKQNICEFFNSIRKFDNATFDAIEGTRNMINATEPFGQLSRDLRPVVRRLKQDLTNLIESMEVSGEWVELINATGILCEETTTQID